MIRRRWPWLIAAALMLLLFVQYCVRIVPSSQQGGAPAPPQQGDGTLRIPVQGIVRDQLVDTFTQARQAGARRHDAIDIMAPRGTPVLAAAPGRVEKLFESADGGHTIYIRSSDGRWSDYYAHLDRYRPGLREGQWVRAGEPIGAVGSTGNANPDGPHLHFAVHAMRPGEKWYDGVAVNPYPLLMAGKR